MGNTKILFIFVLILNVIFQISPQSVDAQDYIGFSRKPNNIILEYTLILNELADHDPTPLMRIFGDGTVNVHFPVYMKRAGDYYLELSDLELQELVSFLNDNGLFDFDALKIGQLRNDKLRELQAESIQNDSESVLFEIQDAATSIFIYNVERYGADSDGNTLVMPWQKKIAWHGLRADAQRFSHLRELVGLAAIEKRLQSIIDREDLIKIED